MRHRRWIGAGLATVALSGCASEPKDAGFSEVREAVAARTGQKVVWNRRTPEDAQATTAVQELLKGDLTADGAVQVALLNNHRLQAVFEELGIAQADLVQGGLLKNPVFGGHARFAGNDPTGTNLELSLVQDFVDLALRPLRRKVSEAALGQARLEVSQAAMDLASDAKGAFYAAQAADQSVEMRQTVLRAAELSLDLARRLHEAGNTTDLEWATEQAAFERSRLDLAEAEAEALGARERLIALMGLWGPATGFRMAGRLPELPAKEIDPAGLESLALAQRLDLAAARQAIEVQARRLGLTDQQRLVPEFNLGLDYEKDPDGSWVLGPSLEVPIPLFDRGQARTSRAQAELAQARETYYALAVEIRSAARAAWYRMRANRERAEHLHKVVLPLKDRIVRETQLEYNGMLIGPFQLFTAKQEEVLAGHQYVESLKAYWLARTDLERAIGGRLAQSEEPPPPAKPAEEPPKEPGHEHHHHHEHEGEKP